MLLLLLMELPMMYVADTCFLLINHLQDKL